MQPVGADGANLVASHCAGPLLYSHLDTSLDGGDGDELITGRPGPVGPLRFGAGTVDGFGLAVARGPAAVALAAFAGARSGSLLLAGSGTHRRGGEPTGVQVYLDAFGAPSAAVAAKCGPPSPLWEEPGAAYVTLRVTGRPGVALAPATADPAGGVVQHAGAVLDAVAGWRAAHLAGHAAQGQMGQIGAACGIGSVSAGWPDKPDLLPAYLEVVVYLVTVLDEDALALGQSLEAQVRSVCAAGELAGCGVEVRTEVVHAAAGTPVDAPIVVAARAAWARELGEPVPLTWAGSTDAVVLRGAGVDTVRLGPSSHPDDDDPRRDVLQLADLAAFGRIYRAMLDR